MPDTRRPTEHARTACVGAAVLGLTVIVFASFGLAIVGLQRLMLTAMTTEADRELLELLTVFDALHGLWLVHLPIWIALGAVLVASGLLVRRGAIDARWLQVACVVSVLELCAYIAHGTLGAGPIFVSVAAPAGGAFGVFARVLGGFGAISSLSLAIPFVWIARAVSPLRA